MEPMKLPLFHIKSNNNNKKGNLEKILIRAEGRKLLSL
jgi:hypothetical protein